MSESTRTKKAIAKSLKKLTQEKAFDKIAIKDITEGCGINRQTFYYHFQDKYELLTWIYYEELCRDNLLDMNFDNWSDKLHNAIVIMKEEKTFYLNTIKNAEEYISQFLMKMAEDILNQAINKLDEAKKISPEERAFCSRFFAHGLTGMTLEWAESGMKEDVDLICERMITMFEGIKRAVFSK